MQGAMEGEGLWNGSLPKDWLFFDILAQRAAMVKSPPGLELWHKPSNHIADALKTASRGTRMMRDLSPEVSPSQYRLRWTCVRISAIDELSNADYIAMQLSRFLRSY
jgi:hypothetical protein